MSQSSTWLWMLCILSALIILVGREMSLQPDGKLHAYFLDVGQGDSILLVSPAGKQIIIDGGPDTSLLTHLGKYMPFLDRTIELVVLTHPDSDHVTALPELLRRYTVERVLLSGVWQNTERYHALLDLVERGDIPISISNPDIDIDMRDGLILDVVWPSSQFFGIKPKNINDSSVAIRALFGNESILLTGDIEEDATEAILRSGIDITSTVLKSPHHGSRTSSSTGFLLATSAKTTMISAGKENSFGHPHPEIVERYRTMGMDIRSTIDEGTISLVFEK